jgi:hypothetical protein
MWYIYTMEFYSAMKKNEWMVLENIILNKITQLRRPKIVCYPSYAGFRSRANAVVFGLGSHTKGRAHIRNGDR